MTAEELIKAQMKIQEEIEQCAIANNPNEEEIEPIYDGVYNADGYLSASRPIMWVLKEPYDDFTQEGKPYGGGWKIYEAFDKDNAWKNPTWQPIIYTTYGILNRCRYEEMDWIRDDISMADVLKQIVYINISKMPAYSTSNDNDMMRKYNLWKPILLKQLSTYCPQIIVFGNTFKYFKHDLVGEDTEPCKRIDGVLNVYEKDGVKMLDAYHPNQKSIDRGTYVNSIVESCL